MRLFNYIKTNMFLLYVIIALAAGSIGSILLASGLLLISQKELEQVSSYLLTFAGGTLLGAAFSGMLPKAIYINGEIGVILNLTLAGIILFFILEKLILWRTCENKDCERQKNASAPLILIGDGLHNFIDGLIITSAFFTSYRFGIIVTITVLAHEIPQELVDFGILINNGYSKTKALAYNLLSGATMFLGGFLAYFTLEAANKFVPYVLAFSAASFIYIALADLVPQMHGKTGFINSFIQVSLIISGVVIIYVLKNTNSLMKQKWKALKVARIKYHQL